MSSDRVQLAVAALEGPLAVILAEALRAVPAFHAAELRHLYHEGRATVRYQVDVSVDGVQVFAIMHDDQAGTIVPLFSTRPPVEGER